MAATLRLEFKCTACNKLYYMTVNHGEKTQAEAEEDIISRIKIGDEVDKNCDCGAAVAHTGKVLRRRLQ